METNLPEPLHRYGWKRGEPDPRDHVYGASAPVVLPSSFRITDGLPSIWDQGDTNSCTAHAWAAAYEFQLHKQGLKDFMPSRLFIYFNERLIEGDTDQDGGATIRDGAKALSQYGTLPESLWSFSPYKVTKKPTTDIYTEALKNVVTEYSAVEQNLTELKTAIYRNHPVAFGIEVFASLESDEVAKSGKVPMPDPSEEYLGGHAVLLVGWDDSDQTFWVRNSWGADWGIQGYFKLPYKYVLNPVLASDFWIILSEQEEP